VAEVAAAGGRTAADVAAVAVEADNQLSFRMDGDWVAPWDVTDD